MLKLRLDRRRLGRRLVAELWLYPDGSRILELSTKCRPSEPFQVAAETRAFLDGARRRPERRAADEDAQGAPLLREAAAGGVTGLRWEWRTEADLDAPAGEVAESDEVYFLSDSSDASVKLRDGRLDVKVLERVEDGLQLWRPVVKAEFPLDADDGGSGRARARRLRAAVDA